MRSRIWWVALFALLVTACGGAYEVTTTVVSGESTLEISVYEPVGDGSWPLVYALPGSGGSAPRDLEVLATELAKNGVLVLASDIAVDNLDDAQQSAECGYRYALSIAEDHGGDLTEPVTMLGFSLGATGALIHGLNDSAYGPNGVYEKCPPAAERPDLVASIAGCHAQTTGIKGGELPNEPAVPMEYDPVWDWDSTTADVLLIAGSDDSVCRAIQSQDAQEALLAAGFDATYVEIAEAEHGEMVFHDIDANWATLPNDHPQGQETVTAILDAIETAG